MRARTKARRGAALLWMIVTISIVAAIAATAAPLLMVANDMDDVASEATILRNVANGVRLFGATITRSAGNFMSPNRLNQLSVTVANGGQAGCTITGTNDLYTATSVTNWTAGGPFGPYQMPSTGGLWTPFGTLNDVPSGSSTAVGATRTAVTDPYFIQVQNVDTTLAKLLDVYVDGTAGQAADTVQYSAASGGTVTLSWRVFFAATNVC